MKAKEDLTVEIPKRFEERLRARFDLRRFKDGGNKISCPLCDAYLARSCKGCPFEKFETLKVGASLRLGCEKWEIKLVNAYFGNPSSVVFSSDSDVKIFKLLKKKAAKLIKFV